MGALQLRRIPPARRHDVGFSALPDRYVALRVSNGLLLATLFLRGYRCSRATYNNPWIFGLVLLLVGLAMVGVAMVLGG